MATTVGFDSVRAAYEKAVAWTPRVVCSVTPEYDRHGDPSGDFTFNHNCGSCHRCSGIPAAVEDVQMFVNGAYGSSRAPDVRDRKNALQLADRAARIEQYFGSSGSLPIAAFARTLRVYLELSG